MKPSVSVIVTAYNQAAYIGDALKSVFAQTFTDFEVIVVDDGSTDGTAVAIGPFKERVNYLHQENRGVAASRNTGVRSARGDLLAFLDGDDIWEPEKLAEQVRAARLYPEAGLIAVNGVQFCGETILTQTLLGGSLIRLFGDSEQLAVTRCYETMLRGNPIFTTSQVMIPARVLNLVGLSNCRFAVASDYDLYLRISQYYEVVVVRRRLVGWRYLSTSVSGPQSLRRLRASQAILAVQSHHLSKTAPEFRNKLKGFIRARVASSCLEAYYYGHKVERVWASRYLLRLLLRHLSCYPVGFYLLGLWCPSWLARMLGPVARRALRRGIRFSSIACLSALMHLALP